ncbi:AraC family transcriptional regulator [Gordonia sp. HY285]|uniref:AraC family transcriptional regulator n=1 Tax=Gordonia liuliyuniae TaxID=2911517 RepID=UPI001F1E23AF|nr:AraC family transcriptional regulator [Gordonia liuliyuniae]MCF8608918.1 AraC family transcriptional regulator [Gordonia liuliyuniae]
MSADAAAALRRLNQSVAGLDPAGRGTFARSPGLSICRGSDESVRLPTVGRPYAAVVLEGLLTVNQLGDITRLSPGDVLISEIRTPQVVEADNAPWSIVVHESSLEEVVSTLLQAGDIGGSSPATPQALDAQTARLLDAVRGLLELNKEPESRFLQGLARNEIIYRLLTGDHGPAVASSIIGLQSDADIVSINSWIKQNFRRQFSVDELARASGMSTSAFHRKFRDVVQIGPVQCQKMLRLGEARKLLLAGAGSVT